MIVDLKIKVEEEEIDELFWSFGVLTYKAKQDTLLIKDIDKSILNKALLFLSDLREQISLQKET